MTVPARKPVEIPAILGLPLLLILAVLAVPYALVFNICLAVRERRLLRRLRSARRVLPWREVEQHLRAGSGTLIIETGHKQGHRFWWTPDDIAAVSPIPVPAFADIDFVLFNPAAPFTRWCFERYLSLQGGTAFLTRSVGLTFPPGFISPDYFTSRFPAARVIATTLTAHSQ